ncbi:MAG: uroporphyrinogen decarboxylase family protein [Phycisphaeraceae bacterium]
MAAMQVVPQHAWDGSVIMGRRLFFYRKDHQVIARERFDAVMAYAPLDRAPLLAEGLRDEVRQAWAAQGLPADADLDALFEYDPRQRLEVGLDPLPQLDHPPLTPADIDQRRWRLNADDPARMPGGAQWVTTVKQWQSAGHLIELPLSRGLFLTMGVGQWASLEPVLYQLTDAPTRVRRVMDDQAMLAAQLAHRVLSQVAVDFASFSEPVADNHGPLISPRLYRQLVLDSYRPVMDVLHGHGVKAIVWITYGNSKALIGDALDAGFNCLWAIETETQAMDYRRLRQQFGRQLRLIGGIDLDCLLAGPAAIDAELESKVPPLLADGGYLPLADGRVRANMPLAHYAHYRRRLEQMVRTG